MNTKQEHMIRKNLNSIKTMDLLELDVFSRKLYLAKQDLNESVFKWLRAGVASRMNELSARHSHLVHDGEIKIEEIR